MAGCTFSHPVMQELTVSINPDRLVWAYGLNTQSYPTYGGEVVQILSVYWDDMTITGTVTSYAEMERIYGWFVLYMQLATQGQNVVAPVSAKHYNQIPVTFRYHERNWQFEIWPKSLPGFRYGTDVVAPTWQVVAAVKEPDAVIAKQITAYSAKAGPSALTSNLQYFTASTADFGASGDLEVNPWASISADPDVATTNADGTVTVNQKSLSAFLAKQTKDLADTFTSFIGDYSGDVATALGYKNISKPPSQITGTPTTPTKTNPPKTKKK